jgi:hypothetical protein
MQAKIQQVASRQSQRHTRLDRRANMWGVRVIHGRDQAALLGAHCGHQLVARGAAGSFILPSQEVNQQG